MLLRKASLNDCDAINTIYNQAVAARRTGDTIPVSIEKRLKWLEQHEASGYPVLVAEMDKLIVGWLSFSSYREGRMAFRHTAEISYYVDEAFHRRSIGFALVELALAEAVKLEFKNLLAIILENNSASIGLLKKAGFQEWAYLPHVADFDGETCGHVYYGINLP